MLVATPGSTAANSYATVAEADAYFGYRPHSGAWTVLSPEQKEGALLFAAVVGTTLMQEPVALPPVDEGQTYKRLVYPTGGEDAVYSWTGSPASKSQALAWPRKGMLSAAGAALPDDVVPDAVKRWQMELAIRLQETDRTEVNTAVEQGLTKLKAGPVELNWGDGARMPSLAPVTSVQFLMRSWWRAFVLVPVRPFRVEVL